MSRVLSNDERDTTNLADSTIADDNAYGAQKRVSDT